jgi:dTDP-4-dehydrorhamnose 3,5-epimerase-like enzyme
MSICKTYNLVQLGDERGSLIALDKLSGLPFDIKRVYYVFNTKYGVARGFHAHKKLHQMAVCLTGSCCMVLDDGVSRESVIMNSGSVGIDLPPMVWHEMHDFSADCILLVVASDYYDEDDYVRDYKDFKKMVSYDS